MLCKGVFDTDVCYYDTWMRRLDRILLLNILIGFRVRMEYC